jgi:deoxycytidylate deaminase
MCRQLSLLGTAAKVAANSEHRTQLGVVIAKGKRVISVGWNKYKSHPRQLSYIKDGKRIQTGSVHAELDAIIGVPQKHLEGATLYIARVLADGACGLSRPCSACRKVIRAAGIRKIVYTENDNKYSVEYIG